MVVLRFSAVGLVDCEAERDNARGRELPVEEVVVVVVVVVGVVVVLEPVCRGLDWAGRRVFGAAGGGGDGAAGCEGAAVG